MSTGKAKRITEILRNYWEDVRGDRPYPLESQIDTESELLQSIWDSCFLVRIDPNAERPYAYSYLGKALVAAYGGQDGSEREVCEALVYPSSMSMVHKFKEVADTKAPINEDGEFTNSVGELIKFRSELLPLGDQDGEVAYILGGMKWKVY